MVVIPGIGLYTYTYTIGLSEIANAAISGHAIAGGGTLKLLPAKSGNVKLAHLDKCYTCIQNALDPPSVLKDKTELMEGFMDYYSETQRRSYESVSEPPPFDVDIVYTWVNGSVQGKLPKGVGKSRVAEHGEMLFSMRGLAKYMPWFKGTIYVVTSGEKPNWLDTSHPQIKMVYHRDIWDEPKYLPTFASRSIEWHLHKIPGLADRFIYFNDDWFIGNYVSPWDFFMKDGGIKMRFESNQLRSATKGRVKWVKKQNKWLKSVYRNAEWLEKKFGNDLELFFLPHSPLVLDKRAIAEVRPLIQKEYSDFIKVKKRSESHLSMTFTVYNYMRYVHRDEKMFEKSVMKSINYQVVDFCVFNCDTLFTKLNSDFKRNVGILSLIMNSKPRFYCLNDENYNDNTASVVNKFMLQQYPDPSPFEKV